MLELELPAEEFFDEKTNVITTSHRLVVKLEHSLVAISNWESKWKKPFMSKMEKKTEEETRDYIRCMCLEPISDSDLDRLIAQKLNDINEYLSDPFTATTIRQNHRPNSQIVTAEVVYGWMVALQIPFEPCERWNFNKLMTLIQVCNTNQTPPKKMSKAETARMYRNLNQSRRARLGTKG